MARIDKAAIVFSMAIVLVGVGFTVYAGQVQNNTIANSAPVYTRTAPVETLATPVENTSKSKTVSVTIPTGNADPGCETTETCYSPTSITINVGDIVEWNNADSVVHTVTSGIPSDGPSGLFNSNLIMPGKSFSKTFDEVGNYDYFDMVHTWMVGNVKVN